MSIVAPTGHRLGNRGLGSPVGQLSVRIPGNPWCRPWPGGKPVANNAMGVRGAAPGSNL